ncbi:MAG: TetR family transcriptional regulator [Rhodocyclaceae bacterium]|nr:TetR family transcriptional regulator [Rhodocyclaceae bacterium]
MSEPDTPERILDAAERLFMAHGFEATTLRMITADARANLAAVNYHFGGKEGLIEALFRRRLGWLNAQWLAALDKAEAEAAGQPLRPHQVLEAFFGTTIRTVSQCDEGGRHFLRLLGRTYTEPSTFIRRFMAREYAEVVRRYKAALFRALPEAPREEVLWRFHFMLGAMSYALSGADALNVLGEDGLHDADPEALHARFMSFLFGGLRAPLPEFASQPAKKPRRTKAA